MPGGVRSFFAWFPGGRVFYERAASFSYSLGDNRRGGWKIFQILIGARGGGWGGLVKGGGGVKKFSKYFPSCIFQPVYPKQVLLV